MLTFSQFIMEMKARLAESASAQGIMHTNPSAEQVHGITERSKFKETRFVIDKSDNMHLGDSHHFVHAMLGKDPNDFYENTTNTKILGYIRHHEGKSIVSAWHKGTYMQKVATHPRIERLLKRKNFVSGHDNA